MSGLYLEYYVCFYTKWIDCKSFLICMAHLILFFTFIDQKLWLKFFHIFTYQQLNLNAYSIVNV